MVARFEEVSEEFKKTNGSVTLPTKGTKYAMAYDFYANKDYIVKPKEVCKIWTDVKAFMAQNVGLLINVRSSMGGKFMLANSQGWIDCDYYGNESNDGNIGVFLLNISDDIQCIKKGDRIAQGMFVNFVIDENYDKEHNNSVERKGGFGSTN